MRTCFACKVEKGDSEFYRCNVRYRQRECKDCCRERKYAWHQSEAGKKSSAATKLKARFGITQEIYDEMLAAQSGKCLVCDATESCLGHKLAVDHNHTTGAVRGLLCKACNVGIGSMGDDAARVERAAQYLRSYQ